MSERPNGVSESLKVGRSERLERIGTRGELTVDTPPPGYFAKRGCKLLEINGRSAEKSVKRDTRGGKRRKRRDLPRRHPDRVGAGAGR